MSLLPFVPKLALRLVGSSPAPSVSPRIEALNASVLLADVTGFTSLIDVLAARYGHRGAERLQEILNECFGPLTELVETRGGDVLAFPGDSALAAWFETEGAPLEQLVHHCTACAIELQAKLDRFRLQDGIELRLRVAVGAGRSWATLVGGVGKQWYAVLQGDAIEQLSGALQVAQPGEVVLSPAARELAGPAVIGAARGRHFVASATPTSPPRLPLPTPDLRSPELVKMFVPDSILRRIEVGQRAWLAEFRNVTVVFLRLKNCPPDAHEVLQRALEFIQTVLARFEGGISQFVADDKGLTVVVGFGAIVGTHQDDPVRAVRAALAIHDGLRHVGVKACLGIATGRTFTGARGGESRLEFAFLGASVVLAARLAEVANDVLCDATTRAASRKAIGFEQVPVLSIKGKVGPVEAWRPTASKPEGELVGLVGLIGRVHEQAAIEHRLRALEDTGIGGVVVLEGEPGIGKTAIVADLMKSGDARAIRILIGAGDSIEQRTPYLAWRPIVAALLGPDAALTLRALQARLAEMLGDDTIRWLPLLNAVLPISLPESDHTLGMTAESRASTARELLARLFDTAVQATPLMIVLEDAHWMDSASWEFTEYAVAHLTRLLVLISVRPLTEQVGPFDQLVGRSDATILRLGALDQDQIQEIVCRRLDTQSIPPALAAFIHRRAEGHPLFAEELAITLQRRGDIVVREGTCQLAVELTEETALTLPDTVRGVVGTRIDQLTAEQQLTIKVAAVLGRQFSLLDLAAVYPIECGREELQQLTDVIAATGLLRAVPDTPDSLSFSHALVQDVAYDLLAFSQRRDLHHRTAEWLEESSVRSVVELTPLLAYHWERAEVVTKAVHYLEKAGERALLKDSLYREAEQFLTRLIALADGDTASRQSGMPAATHDPNDTQHILLARWERMLAQAIMPQGRHDIALRHLERSIKLLGAEVPADTFTCRVEFVGALLRRLIHRPSPPRLRDDSEADRLALVELTHAYDTFVKFLFVGRPEGESEALRKGEILILSGLATLRGVRAAEMVGPSAELSEAYSLFANTVALFRRPKLAGFYTACGRAIAEQNGDQRALFHALTIGQLPLFIQGRWREMTPVLEDGLTLGAELRNFRECLQYELLRGYISFNQGCFAEAVQRFDEVRNRARKHDYIVPRLWATVSLGEVSFRRGHLNDAAALAEECLELASRTTTVDQNSRFQANGLLASAWLRMGELERALKHVDLAIAAAQTGARLSYTPQFGFIGVAETLLAACDRAGPDADQAAPRLRRWLFSLRLIAFCRPILEPWDLLFRAIWSGRRGRRRQQRRGLRQAIKRADDMGLAYESAIARLELARALPLGAPDRRPALDEACVIFDRIGAAHELNNARALAE